MGCYHGYNSRGGAQGVGAATTHAVVSASILILIANYVITELFSPNEQSLSPMTDTAAPKVALHDLTKSFGAKQVLRGVDQGWPCGVGGCDWRFGQR